MAKVKVKTPAKINLGLYVTEKRQDGFHNIQTIFYPIGLFDTLTFEDSNAFSFTSDLKSLPADNANLVIQAKNLLEEYSGESLHISIHLQKNIPVGAGLGGGSSDAAATLNTLNKFSGLNLTVNEIFDLALRLGSDIPYFLNPRPSFAGGRGEILQSCLLHLDLPLVVVNPGISISTKWAYSSISPGNPNFDLSRIESLDLYFLKLYNEKIQNAFEGPVFERFPEIKEIKLLHYKMGAVFSLMSGSGSTVFGIYPDIEIALSAGRLMREKGYFVYIQDGNNSL